MTKIALLIGVSQYQSDLTPLPKASKDVEAMENVLQNPAIGRFERVETQLDPDAQTMREEIEVIFSGSQKDDLVLLFFSGHGIKDDRGKLYFATNNTRKNDQGKLIWSTAVAASWIQDLMSQSRCKHQVVILDCCFSGAFAAGMTAKGTGNVDIQTQLGGEGRAVLTSSTSTQYSFEQQESDLSIYSRYIVEGIATGAADLDSDGWIEVQELHEYAKGKVQATAPAMMPEIYAVKEGFKIRLAKALITDPRLKYRKEVERYASRADIPDYRRIILDTLREQLSLSSEVAAAIEDEVLRPYRERLQHLQRYREALTAAVVEYEYPLSAATADDLKHFQGMLGLRDEDIQPIEDDIKAQVRQQAAQSPVQPRRETISTETTPSAPRRNHTTPPGITRKRFLQWAGWGGSGLIATLVVSQILNQDPEPIEPVQAPITPSESTDKPTSETKPTSEPTEDGEKFAGLPLLTDEFETVTVNAKGEETSRDNHQAKLFKEDLGNGVILEMVSIPAGEFEMGSPSNEKDRDEDESPQHKVSVPAFFMGRFPVTQAQYQEVIGSNPANFKGDNRPVERVSWHEATKFCQKLSEKTGRNYRLPSEAEWEYACRAGTTTPFHFGATLTTNLANYDGNYTYQSEPKGKYRGQTTEVGSFPPNAFGLYDMHGNVWEWCLDRWHDNYNGAPDDGSAWLNDNDNDNRYCLLRGGSWYDNPRGCRSANRFRSDPGARSGLIGLRVVCSSA
ncbi:MAG: SUMF1/EgtB/PvdO family nonheme iron enzyme [Waterburya sp.]